jgi:hypothetical protein
MKRCLQSGDDYNAWLVDDLFYAGHKRAELKNGPEAEIQTLPEEIQQEFEKLILCSTELNPTVLD